MNKGKMRKYGHIIFSLLLRALPNGAPEHNEQFAAFCLLMQKSPTHLLFLAETEICIEITEVYDKIKSVITLYSGRRLNRGNGKIHGPKISCLYPLGKIGSTPTPSHSLENEHGHLSRLCLQHRKKND
jgi:hypothetical protein